MRGHVTQRSDRIRETRFVFTHLPAENDAVGEVTDDKDEVAVGITPMLQMIPTTWQMESRCGREVTDNAEAMKQMTPRRSYRRRNDESEFSKVGRAIEIT